MHINDNIKIAKKVIGLLGYLSKYLPLKTLDQMYKIFVRPHFDYCDVIYHIPQLTNPFHSTITLSSLMKRIGKIKYQTALAITGGWLGSNRNKLYDECDCHCAPGLVWLSLCTWIGVIVIVHLDCHCAPGLCDCHCAPGLVWLSLCTWIGVIVIVHLDWCDCHCAPGLVWLSLCTWIGVIVIVHLDWCDCHCAPGLVWLSLCTWIGVIVIVHLDWCDCHCAPGLVWLSLCTWIGVIVIVHLDWCDCHCAPGLVWLSLCTWIGVIVIVHLDWCDCHCAPGLVWLSLCTWIGVIVIVHLDWCDCHCAPGCDCHCAPGLVWLSLCMDWCDCVHLDWCDCHCAPGLVWLSLCTWIGVIVIVHLDWCDCHCVIVIVHLDWCDCHCAPGLVWLSLCTWIGVIVIVHLDWCDCHCAPGLVWLSLCTWIGVIARHDYPYLVMYLTNFWMIFKQQLLQPNELTSNLRRLLRSAKSLYVSQIAPKSFRDSWRVCSLCLKWILCSVWNLRQAYLEFPISENYLVCRWKVFETGCTSGRHPSCFKWAKCTSLDICWGSWDLCHPWSYPHRNKRFGTILKIWINIEQTEMHLRIPWQVR